MDWCRGQSKKYFRTSSLFSQEQLVKEGCSSTFSSLRLSSNVLVLSLLSFLFSYIICWCFSPSCYSRGRERWWSTSWCDSSEAAFQIISHDLNIQSARFNTDLDVHTSAGILVVTGKVWGVGISYRSPDFSLSHPFSTEKLLAIAIFALRVHTSNGWPRLQQKKQKVNFSKSIITNSSQAL